jgi:hypothetical protein
MMGVTFLKRDRHGKGKILSQQEIQLLFSQGLTNLARSLFVRHHDVYSLPCQRSLHPAV